MDKTNFMFWSVVFILFFTSCEKNESGHPLINVGDLEGLCVHKIEVSREELPVTALDHLETHYSNSEIEKIFHVPDFGYEVWLIKMNGVDAGQVGKVYFDLEGEILIFEYFDGEGEIYEGICGIGGEQYEEDCFDLVLPVTFIMPDGQNITVTTEEDFMLLRDWYENNPDAEEEPDLQYPVDIEFEDGTTMTVNSYDEMEEAEELCEG